MAVVYDDNFGFWHIDGQEERAFFEYVQSQSTQKPCCRCEHRVRLMAHKTLCASCVAALECGAPASMEEYQRPAPRKRPVRKRKHPANIEPSLHAVNDNPLLPIKDEVGRESALARGRGARLRIRP